MGNSQEDVKWNFQEQRVLGKEKELEIPGDMNNAGWMAHDSIKISRNMLI